MTTTMLDPKLLGFWARCVREAQHLSQEAIAEAAGITVRTVQRFEAGEGVQIGSRRSLAKALGYGRPGHLRRPEVRCDRAWLLC